MMQCPYMSCASLSHVTLPNSSCKQLSKKVQHLEFSKEMLKYGLRLIAASLVFREMEESAATLGADRGQNYIWPSLTQLVCTGRFPNGAHTQKEIFMQSLICNVQPNTKLLKVIDDGCLSDAAHGRRAAHSGAHLSASMSHANIGPSPHPTLDGFIASICNAVSLAVLLVYAVALSVQCCLPVHDCTFSQLGTKQILSCV